jgi:hypothetical protein
MRKTLRVAGNIGLIVGQCVLLFASRDIGLAILIMSSVISLPYFVTHKYWDIVVLIVFSMSVNAAGLFFGMGR